MSDRALAYSTEPLRAIEHRKSALAKLNRGDGVTGAVKACALLRAASIETRFDLLRCHRPTPAVRETALPDVTAQRPQAWASHATRPRPKSHHLGGSGVKSSTSASHSASIRPAKLKIFSHRWRFLPI